jgi:CheY-like chemotaxis protein
VYRRPTSEPVDGPAPLGVARTSLGGRVGLYVASEPVEAHGGRIWATSDGPGTGSAFSVTLSLEAADRDADVEAPVLVVDDDASLRQFIAEALREEGYRVIPAADGQEALERLETELPALILLDWMMPRLDGASFAAERRRRHPEARIPIVVMSAGGEARTRAASIWADSFISKPFDLALLLDQVARHVRRWSRAADRTA